MGDLLGYYVRHLAEVLSNYKGKLILKMNHILKMKEHSETHFENKNMFLET